MHQRTALIIAGSITAFVLVLVGGIAVNLASRSSATVQAINQPVPAAPLANESTASLAKLAPDQAAQIALNVVPGARLTRTPELVNFQGAVAYEVVLDQGNVYIDANSGKLLMNGAATLGTQNGRGEGHRGDESIFGGDHDD